MIRILDDMDWPEELRGEIQDGLHTMQETVLGESRLEEVQVAADAEGGGFFFDKDGLATFVNFDFLDQGGDEVTILLTEGSTIPDSTVGSGETVVEGEEITVTGDEPGRSQVPQWSAGAIGDELEILDANTDWSQSRVKNDIRFQATDGEEQRETETASWSLYGQRTLRKLGFQNDDDSQVGALADRALSFLQWDRKRITDVTIHPTTEQAAQDLLDTRLGDRIRVTVRTADWSYTSEYWINRISHAISETDWTVNFRIDDVDLSSPVIVKAFDDDAFTEGFN